MNGSVKDYENIALFAGTSFSNGMVDKIPFVDFSSMKKKNILEPYLPIRDSVHHAVW